jgi:hypothetical protein
MLTLQNAAMIAGISLIINPGTPHAADMKEILRLFMAQHPHDPKADDFTQQEATIVSEILFPMLIRRSPLFIAEGSSTRQNEHKRAKGRCTTPLPSAVDRSLHFQGEAPMARDRMSRHGRLGSLDPTCAVPRTIDRSSCKYRTRTS